MLNRHHKKQYLKDVLVISKNDPEHLIQICKEPFPFMSKNGIIISLIALVKTGNLTKFEALEIKKETFKLYFR
jgi:hypothetical protein